MSVAYTVALAVLMFAGLQVVIWMSSRCANPVASLCRDPVAVELWQRGKCSGRVEWSQLVGVEILVFDPGSWWCCMVLSLASCEGCDLRVPYDMAVNSGLLGRLQRLPGFDREMVARAESCLDDGLFLCWQGAPGEAAVCGANLPPGEPHEVSRKRPTTALSREQ